MLIVNDEIYLLEAYAMQLGSQFEITCAENGLQALQVVCSYEINYFDVILLDINMPIINGFETISRLTNYFRSLIPGSNLSKEIKTLVYALTGD